MAKHRQHNKKKNFWHHYHPRAQSVPIPFARINVKLQAKGITDRTYIKPIISQSFFSIYQPKYLLGIVINRGFTTLLQSKQPSGRQQNSFSIFSDWPSWRCNFLMIMKFQDIVCHRSSVSSWSASASSTSFSSSSSGASGSTPYI